RIQTEIDVIDSVGLAADVVCAVRQIDALEPDLLFLDVQLTELNGLGVLQEIHHQPAVVFTTAHDRYAVAAFEVQAIDYLLKPFGRRRLLQALERVRGRLTSLRPRVAGPTSPGEPGPLLRLARTVRGELMPLRLDAATRFEAA